MSICRQVGYCYNFFSILLMLIYSRLRYINILIRMEPQVSTRKILQENKKYLQDLVKRRHVYFQAAEIYGGCAGLYDLGPIGSAIKNNIEQLWRDHFVLEEDMLEINSTCVTPQIVLENSGHVAKFTDLMVRDVKNSQGFRADKLIAEWIENKINKDKAKLKQQELAKFKHITTYIDSMSAAEIDEIIKNYKIKSPETGNELGPAQPFNLMFKTSIGPSGTSVGYLRPETAQGMFLNFNKLLDYNGGRMPFAAAQIGLGFRNQIAPRSGLLRVREFPMAEIEHFVDPKDKSHPKFKKVADFKLPLISAQDQADMKQHAWVAIGDAVSSKTVNNQTLGYFLVRIYQFLEECGINVKEHLRFRQHMKDEMAHYASDCWDAEIEMGTGWVECVGCADRSAYDLEHHSSGSGSRLVAARKFKEAIPTEVTQIVVDKQIVGKQFKKDSQEINAYLEKLSEADKKKLKAEYDANDGITIIIQNKQFKLNKTHLTLEQKIVNIGEEKYIPNVIEPSFGLGRIMSALLEHCFRIRSQERTYLCLKPKIAPTKVSILPLQADEKFDPIIAEIRALLKKRLVSCKVDSSGQSIGRRYSRTDEIGIPFAITIDFQTVQDRTITLRELHTMKQIRIPMADIDKVVCELALEQRLWSDVIKEYPEFVSTEKDEDEKKEDKKEQKKAKKQEKKPEKKQKKKEEQKQEKKEEQKKVEVTQQVKPEKNQ